ncbi:MAG UNVERIFIED_CONTAM: hypothetical protein LVQ98_06200 [Rickettsiaceae bacterium]
MRIAAEKGCTAILSFYGQILLNCRSFCSGINAGRCQRSYSFALCRQHGGHIECVNLLLNHKGINPNPSNKAGIKLLDLLIQKGIPKLLSY